jgi:hypothetical protein
MQRIVLLGASNLQRTFSHAVSTAEYHVRGPLHIHAVMGCGRSYGLEAGYLGKKFSGIFSSSVWGTLDHEPPLPTLGFVTDVGNDLPYGVEVVQVLEWVSRCVHRLREHGAQVVLTELPLASLEQMTPRRFEVLRWILFPRCALSWPTLLDRARELNAGLMKLAEAQEIPIFSLPNAWYGWDPVHPRRAHYTALWQHLFAAMLGSSPTENSRARAAWRTWYWGWTKPPHGTPITNLEPSSTVRVVLNRNVTLFFH